MSLPSHWNHLNRRRLSRPGGPAFIRLDGVTVEIALWGSKDDVLVQHLGWRVVLPWGEEDALLPGSRFFLLGDVLKKIDQRWEPPENVRARMPRGWFGGELEQLAREAPDEPS